MTKKTNDTVIRIDGETAEKIKAWVKRTLYSVGLLGGFGSGAFGNVPILRELVHGKEVQAAGVEALSDQLMGIIENQQAQLDNKDCD